MVTNDKSRPLAESHSSHGAMSAEPDELTLPGWLNAARGTTSYERVVHILEMIHESEQSSRHIVAAGAHFHVGPKKKSREHTRLLRASDRVHTELQQALTRYTFNIRLTGVLYGGWLLNMYCPQGEDDFTWETRYAYRPRPGEIIVRSPTYLVSEGDAILAALRLAERGLLARVRVCTRCSLRWLFAKHKNYRFCGSTCREGYYTNTPEYRASKARQMREYRNRLRRREQATSKHL